MGRLPDGGRGLVKIRLATPAPPDRLDGNRVLAERWAGFLADMGHDVELDRGAPPSPGTEMLIAIHAKKSAAAVAAHAALGGGLPIVVILAGTDVYGAVQEGDAEAMRSIELADLLVTLQPLAARELAAAEAAKVRVVFQSALAARERARPRRGLFDISMIGNIRRLKDHLTLVKALELLPPSSKAQARHAGNVVEEDLAERLRAESRSGRRYRWLGPLGHEQAKALLATSRLLVHPSRREGGANAVGEALVAGVPVLASRIPGSVGLLGTGYPGYFPVGDARRLAELIAGLERDAWRLDRLRSRCRRLAERFGPRAEFESIRRVVEEAVALARPRQQRKDA